MASQEKETLDQECKYCGSSISVGKGEIKNPVLCPQCGKPNTVGEEMPEAEEAVQESSEEATSS